MCVCMYACLNVYTCERAWALFLLAFGSFCGCVVV